MIKFPQAAAWSFALAISASPIFILVYGPLGLHGSGVLTASFLCLTVAGVAAFGSGRNFHLTALDIPFLAFVAGAAISFVLNPLVASTKELILFAITIFAYFAGRLLTRDHISILKRACFRLSVFIVVIGTVVTVPFLVSDWMTGQLGRPWVFGFDNAGSAFSISLGYLVIAVLTSEPNWGTGRRQLAIVVLISISTAVLAASMVRFSLLAILATSALSFLISVRERKFSLLLFAVLITSVCAGWVVRSDNAKIYAAYTLEDVAGDSVPTWLRGWYLSRGVPPSYEAERNPHPSSSCLSVNTRNSVAIRKQLLLDALDLMPRAGLAGFGVASFEQMGCFKGMSPHNDLLQAAVEFGWVGGAAFFAMIVLAPLLLFRPSLSNRDAKFLFLLSAFMTMLAMIYGQVTGDLSLFMVMGVAVSATLRRRSDTKSWEKPNSQTSIAVLSRAS